MRVLITAIVVSMVFLVNLDAVGQETGNEEKIRKLEGLAPAEPTVVDPNTKVLVQEIAKTRRLDAAVSLIHCFGFNDDPSWGHQRSSQELIPTIQLLRLYYDKSIVPVIYAEALQNAQPWFRERAALAIKSMLTDAEIKKMNQTFSLESNNNAEARAFTASLLSKSEDVELATYSTNTLTKLDQRLEEIQQKKKQ